MEERRLIFGRNALKGRRSVHPVILLLRHLFNVTSLILFVAVALAIAVEEWIEGGVIGFIIVLNTVVGFLQVRKKGGREGWQAGLQTPFHLSSPLFTPSFLYLLAGVQLGADDAGPPSTQFALGPRAARRACGGGR